MRRSPGEYALAPPIEPCLGLGILKSCLTRAEISARVFHFAPDLLRWLTHDTYQYIADSWGLNEFVFTGKLDPVLGERQQAAVVKRVLTYFRGGHRYDQYPTAESVLDLFMSVRQEVVPRFLDEAADTILESTPKVVGFTCLFDQTIASLALATQLKESEPSLTVIFGGYALEGAPGRTVAGAFPCIDYLVVGDGEQEIVNLSRRALNGREPVGAAMVTAPEPTATRLLVRDAPEVRGGKSVGKVIRAQKYPLDNSPLPDYDDWYDGIAALEAEHQIHIETDVLPVEASRGCWWGQTKHCVFCGIDDDTLQYRYKDADLTLDMLEKLRARYGDVAFRFSDYIMPKNYYTDLLPRLAEYEPRFRLHSEIKANHPPERVRLLVDAGFIAVQPGVESFSTDVLRAMDKGVRGIDNACLLKTGYVERLCIYYNILYGLPGDSCQAYEAMIELLPRIYHFMPPVSRTETMVTRFAPLQGDPERFGIKTKPVHHECYDVMWSDDFVTRTGFALDGYAYYFERNFAYTDDLASVYAQLVLQVDHWKKLHQTRFVELSYECEGEIMEITDSRFSPGVTYSLSVPASVLLRRADHHPVHFERVSADLRADGLLSADASQQALAELEERRLIWREGDLILGLAVPKAISDRHRDSAWNRTWLSIYA